MKRNKEVSLSQLNESDIMYQKSSNVYKKNENQEELIDNQTSKSPDTEQQKVIEFQKDWNQSDDDQGSGQERCLEEFQKFIRIIENQLNEEIPQSELQKFKFKQTRDVFPNFNEIQKLYEQQQLKFQQNKKLKKNWSEDDLYILIWVVYNFSKKFNLDSQNLSKNTWIDISKLVPGKNPSQCKFRWLQIQKQQTARDIWDADEKNLLTQLYNSYGPKWQVICQELYQKREHLSDVKYRSSKQCREHYINHLNPNVKRGPWTKKEDQKLLKLVQDYGKKWADIAKIFQNRTENTVKNRYNALIKNGQQQDQDDEIYQEADEDDASEDDFEGKLEQQEKEELQQFEEDQNEISEENIPIKKQNFKNKKESQKSQKVVKQKNQNGKAKKKGKQNDEDYELYKEATYNLDQNEDIYLSEPIENNNFLRNEKNYQEETERDQEDLEQFQTQIKDIIQLEGQSQNQMDKGESTELNNEKKKIQILKKQVQGQSKNKKLQKIFEVEEPALTPSNKAYKQDVGLAQKGALSRFGEFIQQNQIKNGKELEKEQNQQCSSESEKDSETLTESDDQDEDDIFFDRSNTPAFQDEKRENSKQGVSQQEANNQFLFKVYMVNSSDQLNELLKNQENQNWYHGYVNVQMSQIILVTSPSEKYLQSQTGSQQNTQIRNQTISMENIKDDFCNNQQKFLQNQQKMVTSIENKMPNSKQEGSMDNQIDSEQNMSSKLSFNSFAYPLIFGIGANSIFQDIQTNKQIDLNNSSQNNLKNFKSINNLRGTSFMSIEDDKNFSLSKFLAENYNQSCQKRKSIRNSFLSNSCRSLANLDSQEEFEDNNHSKINPINSNTNNNQIIQQEIQNGYANGNANNYQNHFLQTENCNGNGNKNYFQNNLVQQPHNQDNSISDLNQFFQNK